MTDLVALSGHVLAMILYAYLAWDRGQQGAKAPFNGWLLGAFMAVSLWSGLQAFAGQTSIASDLAENVRNLAFLGFMFVIVRSAGGLENQRRVSLLYATVAVTTLCQVVLAVAAITDSEARPALATGGHSLAVIATSGLLVLVHNLYGQASAQSRSALQPTLIALAAMWAYDLHLYTFAYLTGDTDHALFAFKGVVLALLAALHVLAGSRNPDWQVKLSRKATFQSISIIAILSYLILMISGSRAIAAAGGAWVSLARTGLIAGSLIAALVLLLPLTGLRAWMKVTIAKHFFEHRYDYREDWLRFTRHLGGSGESGRPLGERVVKALGDMAGAPGGLLLVPGDDGRLSPAARWNWRLLFEPAGKMDRELAAFLESSAYVIDFGAIRNGILRRGDLTAALPDWLMAEPALWAGIPLVHNERLVGIVLLDQPLVRRALDWEDYDLFRTAGIQAASYLAEARGQEALADVQRFDEFNRRFAFILHDIKNLVSQLSLVAHNAERHADNPEFRADMISTLRNSVQKMNDLLSRLSREKANAAEPPRTMLLQPVVAAIASARKQAANPIEAEGDARSLVVADPARLEQALGHLVQNAIDASPAALPVRLCWERRGQEVAIEVADAGPGMSDEFVRTRLFQPFSSTKPNGFGIGAFEARMLVSAMGGRIEVATREGEGSRFTLFLPAGDPAELEDQRKIA